MEFLTIHNFLNIKKAELEIKRINIIIGEQSTGKSVIAKILYLFKDFLSSEFKQVLINNENQRGLELQLINAFINLFPEYSWGEQEFTITYTLNDIILIIQREKNEQNSFQLNFTYSDYFKTIFTHLSNEVKKRNQSLAIIGEPINIFAQEKEIEKLIYEYISKLKNNELLKKVFFIPASRSFFANIQEKPYLFTDHGIVVDPWIDEFGFNYQEAKDHYFIIDSIDEDDEDKQLINRLKKIVNRIISGEYLYEEEQDFIYSSSNQKKVSLIHASSGQQEALPMLLILSVFPFIFHNNNNNPIFFIEEPEAHLFPFAQKDIVNLFGLLYQNKGCDFFITTHSPYILTAFNNMIMASNIEKEKKEKISVIEHKVDYNDVAAYTIKNGIVESILDDDVNLIGINILDQVSDILNEEFDKLMEIQINS